MFSELITNIPVIAQGLIRLYQPFVCLGLMTTTMWASTNSGQGNFFAKLSLNIGNEAISIKVLCKQTEKCNVWTPDIF